MNSLTYLAQVTACTAVFYLFYYLFLNRLTFFTINRWYLLATVILSFTIPLIKIQVNEPHVYNGVVEKVVNVYVPQTAPTVEFNPVVKHAEVKAPIRWDVILKLTYLAAVVGLFIQLAITLIGFFKRMKGKRIAKLGNVNVLSGNKKISNGSFLNYIFLNDDELSADEIQQIIAHEMLHVRLYHSIDRIVVKLAQIILWFNPFIYLYSRSVEENHEFEVDKAMAANNDKHNYANLLLHLSVAGNGMLYHNFSKVPLKRRITMLFNQPSSNMRKIIYVLVVPVVLISCLAFARLRKNDVNSKYSVIDHAELLPSNTSVVIDGKVFTKDIIYKISAECIKIYSFYPPNKYYKGKAGEIADFNKDKQSILIETKNGVITYMDDREKQNLIIEHGVTHGLYDRVVLKNADGTLYDEVFVESPGHFSAMSKISHNAKVGFVINGKVLNEEAFKNLPDKFKVSLNNADHVNPLSRPEFGKLNKLGYQFDLKPYETLFTFELVSKNAQKSMDVAVANRKAWEKTDDYKNKMKLSELLMGKTINVAIQDVKRNSFIKNKTDAVVFDYQSQKYTINFDYSNEFSRTKQLNPGDQLKIKVKNVMIINGEVKYMAGQKNDTLIILPAAIYRGSETVFEEAALKTADIKSTVDTNRSPKKSVAPQTPLTNNNIAPKPKVTKVRYPGEKINNNYHSELYNRNQLPGLKADSDLVTVDVRGAHGESTIAHTAKVAFFINKKLYSEDSFKKLTPESQKVLFNSHGIGVGDPSGYEWLSKNFGFRVNFDGYAAAFFLTIKEADLTTELKAAIDTSKNTKKQPTPPKGYIKRTKSATIGADKTPDEKLVDKMREAIANKTVTVTVKAIDQPIGKDTKAQNKPTSGIVFDYDGHEYVILCWNKPEKELKKKLKPGDVITIKVATAGSGTDMPVFVTPVYVIKDKVKIYEAAPDAKVIGPVKLGNVPVNTLKDIRVSGADEVIRINKSETKLYGKVHLNVGETEINAEYIRIDDEKKTIFASGKIDNKTQNYTGLPVARMGKAGSKITCDSLLLNYETMAAHVWNSKADKDLQGKLNSPATNGVAKDKNGFADLRTFEREAIKEYIAKWEANGRKIPSYIQTLDKSPYQPIGEVHISVLADSTIK